MTSEQENDLLVEWSLYGPIAQKKIVDEYLSITSKANCNWESFLAFLQERIDIVGYWEKTGQI